MVLSRRQCWLSRRRYALRTLCSYQKEVEAMREVAKARGDGTPQSRPQWLMQLQQVDREGGIPLGSSSKKVRRVALRY